MRSRVHHNDTSDNDKNSNRNEWHVVSTVNANANANANAIHRQPTATPNHHHSLGHMNNHQSNNTHDFQFTQTQQRQQQGHQQRFYEFSPPTNPSNTMSPTSLSPSLSSSVRNRNPNPTASPPMVTAVPGRPKRRRKKKTRQSQLPESLSITISHLLQSEIFLAIALWYMLGVISITTSKILLSKYNISPLSLTFQQLLLGGTFLRYLLSIGFMTSVGIQPWPVSSSSSSSTTIQSSFASRFSFLFSSFHIPINTIDHNFLRASCFFAMGFLATNFGFSGTSAAFVETIKAAEPITSALLVVSWRIETLSKEETFSLLGIVIGVLLCTLGNTKEDSNDNKDITHHHHHHHHRHDESHHSAIMESIQSCLIVMCSNLFFSFRVLFQKIYRNSQQIQLDDLNLQYRMQHLGAVILLLPVLLYNIISLFLHHEPTQDLKDNHNTYQLSWIWRYFSLALVNGLAFTSYNLASTFILSRISVVYHAALNCIRRIFAIIMTSIIFGIPMTFQSICGIILCVVGFMAFTIYKSKRKKQQQEEQNVLPLRSLP